MRRTRIGRLFAGMGPAGLAWLVPAVARACAVCGTGPGVEGDPTARGFYWGVLFLMVLPFAVAGSIGGWLVCRYWRAHGIHWRDVWIGRLAWTHKENTP